MSFDKFLHYLRAYSGQIKRWPEHAMQLFDLHAHSQEGRAAIAEEEQLDQILDGYNVDAPLTPAFMARIYGIAAGVPAVSAEWGRRYVSYSAASLVMCLILGLVIGIQLSGSPYFAGLPARDLSTILSGGANVGGDIL